MYTFHIVNSAISMIYTHEILEPKAEVTVQKTYESLMSERNALLKKGAHEGLLLTFLSCVVCIVTMLPVIYFLSEVRANQFVGKFIGELGFFMIVTCMTGGYALFKNYSVTTSRRILVLRHFAPYSEDNTNLSKLIGEACRGLATPFTVKDNSITDQFPIGSEHFFRRLCVYLAVLLSLIFSVAFASLVEYHYALLVFIANFCWIGLAFYFCFLRVMKGLWSYTGTESNYNELIQEFFGSERRPRTYHNGIRVLIFNKEIWKPAIEQAIQKADLVIIDVSVIRDNLLWEIERTFNLISPESIVLCWRKDDLTRRRNKLNGNIDANQIPTHSRERIETVVPKSLFLLCKKFSYSREKSDAEEGIVEANLVNIICSILAQKEVGENTISSSE